MFIILFHTDYIEPSEIDDNVLIIDGTLKYSQRRLNLIGCVLNISGLIKNYFPQTTKFNYWEIHCDWFPVFIWWCSFLKCDWFCVLMNVNRRNINDHWWYSSVSQIAPPRARTWPQLILDDLSCKINSLKLNPCRFQKFHNNPI